MSMESSTETQPGTGAEPKIPPPGEERARVFGDLRLYRSTIAGATDPGAIGSRCIPDGCAPSGS